MHRVSEDRLHEKANLAHGGVLAGWRCAMTGAERGIGWSTAGIACGRASEVLGLAGGRIARVRAGGLGAWRAGDPSVHVVTYRGWESLLRKGGPGAGMWPEVSPARSAACR
jgi:hypothetical protein